MVKIGHDELLRLLARHLRSASDRMVWSDMQLGPMHSARPDVWTLNKSYSNPRPLAYECKVSVADFRSDVTTGKWQEYLQYSCAVTFAVPIGLITKADLPKGCGLMAWNGERWTTTKAPTLNPCPPLSRDLMMKLLIDGFERAAAQHRLDQRRTWQAEEAVRKKFGAAAATLITEEIDFDDRLARLRKRFADEEQRARDDRTKRRQEEEKELSGTRREVCEILALPADSSVWQIRSQVRELAQAVSQDSEVRQLRVILESVRQSLERAEKTPTTQAIRETPA